MLEHDHYKHRIEELERALAAEKERAEYALRNLDITERARQEEMRKRDELLAVLEGVEARCSAGGYVGMDGQYLKDIRAVIAKVTK